MGFASILVKWPIRILVIYLLLVYFLLSISYLVMQRHGSDKQTSCTRHVYQSVKHTEGWGPTIYYIQIVGIKCMGLGIESPYKYFKVHIAGMLKPPQPSPLGFAPAGCLDLVSGDFGTGDFVTCVFRRFRHFKKIYIYRDIEICR